MKAPHYFYSFIDPSVFISLAIAASTSLAVLVYKVYHFEPCQEIEISVKNGLLHAGEIIQFKAVSNKEVNKDIHWDFGTQESSNKMGAIVNHTFDKPGWYEVVLNINNHCKSFKTIYVQEALLVVDKTHVAHFSGPEMVEVGKEVTFKDSTKGATQWEWWFGENNFVDATAQEASYTFKTIGRKKIRLLVNGDKVGEKIIEVYASSTNQISHQQKSSRKKPVTIEMPERPNGETFQKPLEEKSSELNKFPEIPQQELEAIVKGMVEGERSEIEFYPYLCGGQHMKVNYNGTLMSLSELSTELRKVKKSKRIKELEINVGRNPYNNCIISMNVILEKKGFPFF